MKTLLTTAALALLAMPALAGGAPDGAKTMLFDGCLAYQVEGANYYNFVDPTCKGPATAMQSTGAEERKAARAEDEGCGPKT